MYDEIVLTLILFVFMWIAVTVSIAVYLLRKLVSLRNWLLPPPPRVSEIMPTREVVKLSVPEYVVARVATYAAIHYLWKKMK